MFTAEQLNTAHKKVKSGADFPAYIHEIKTLGVSSYSTYVSDGHTDFAGANGHFASWPAKYDSLIIADETDQAKFIADLKAHQQGKSDYMSFCKQAAAAGVEKWMVDTTAMTCTYYNKTGERILEEIIP